MQISSSTRSILLGTGVGVSLALSAGALAVAVSGDDGHGERDHSRPAFAAQQHGGPGGQAYDQAGTQQSAPTGPPMQTGAS